MFTIQNMSGADHMAMLMARRFIAIDFVMYGSMILSFTQVYSTQLL
jgi:hypothetical protein